MVDYSKLPWRMQDDARCYIEHGHQVGHFLTALFSNDLVGAFSRADGTNKAAMHIWASFLYSEAPRGCWGSEDAVHTWQAHRGLAGLADHHQVRDILILPEDTP